MAGTLTTDDVIEQLGGRPKAAKTCGVTEWATYKWDRKGIPAQHWSRIKSATGISLDMLAAAKPARPRSIRKRA